MFSFSGFLKTLGMVLLVFITISFILGFFQLNHIGILLTIMYGVSYVLNGILAPVWNPKTPYFASYLSSITLTVFNLFFALYFLDIMVLADPMEVNSGLVINSSLSLIATFITINVYIKRQGIHHA